jgi:drug/metabolite transporter (DMT)-like permease
MQNETSLQFKNNLTGSLWMVLSMAAFALEDMFLKLAAKTIPLGQVLVLFGICGTIIFAIIAKTNHEKLYTEAVSSTAMKIRAFFEVCGRLFYILAVTLTPLSSATAILQATPLVVVSGAALIFGEQVGWRRWTAIIIGLIGVMIIIQPGTESFSALSILAVIGMLGLAGRDLASRAAPASLSSSILGFYGFLCVIIAGTIFSIWDNKSYIIPDGEPALYLSAAIIIGILAYASLMKAMRTGDVSSVTPFRYTRLIFGITLGLLFFGETLSVSMMIGCVLIVFSGLFILWRGKQTQT